MKVFYVSYDARGNVDSENLRNRLEELGGRNVLKSVQILKLKDKYSVDDVLNDLCEYIDENAGMVVVETNDHVWFNIDDPPLMKLY